MKFKNKDEEIDMIIGATCAARHADALRFLCLNNEKADIAEACMGCEFLGGNLCRGVVSNMAIILQYSTHRMNAGIPNRKVKIHRKYVGGSLSILQHCYNPKYVARKHGKKAIKQEKKKREQIKAVVVG